MSFGGDLIGGTVKERRNRFLTSVLIGGREVDAFLPNPGRLSELIFPGSDVLLKEEAGRPERKTDYDLVAVEKGETVVSVDTRMPNKLVGEALRREALAGLKGYAAIRPEYSHGRSRFDFLLDGDSKCLLEVKSVTLVESVRALFPDAPTKRGRRHVRHLAEALEDGFRAVVLFLIQRDDASTFSPHWEMDRQFSVELVRAADEGVELHCYRAKVTRSEVRLGERVPVDLDWRPKTEAAAER